ERVGRVRSGRHSGRWQPVGGAVAAGERIAVDLATISRYDMTLLDGRPLDGMELAAAVEMYLGRDSKAHRDLIAYAWARAHGGVRELCRQRGWPRRSLYRRVNRAAATVAASLNGRPFQPRLPLAACA